MLHLATTMGEHGHSLRLLHKFGTRCVVEGLFSRYGSVIESHGRSRRPNEALGSDLADKLRLFYSEVSLL